MEKLVDILNQNELVKQLRVREDLTQVAPIENIYKNLKGSLYEGFYDEIGNYIVTFQKKDLEKALATIFGAYDAQII